jgi:hypothetical protein
MARPKTNGALSISQLERLLESRRREAAELERERGKLVQRLDVLQRRLSELSGDGGAGRGGRMRNGTTGGRATRGGRGPGRPRGRRRSRNAQSLVAVMESVLDRAGKPMRVGEIMDAVQSEGYRSNSANFRGIVNQTLIKEKRFTSAGRGIYQLKK